MDIVTAMEELARKWHQRQSRRGPIALPYIIHPEAVVALLKQWGYDELNDAETLAMAWGHDLLEDTPVTRDEIVAAAGEKVYKGIEGLTFRYENGISDDEFDRRKEEYIKRVCKLPPEVLVVKLADRMCNTYDFLRTDRAHAEKYFRSGKVLFEGAAEYGDRLKGRDKIFADCKNLQLWVGGMGVVPIGQFLKNLSTKAVDHIAYYHYTNWKCFVNMMKPVSSGEARGHRMLVLTRASDTNDGIEAKWSSKVYMACFSLSRYEDVAMWMNYGKRNSDGADAVRIKFTEDSLEAWKSTELKNRVYKANAKGDGSFDYEPLGTDVLDVRFYGVAYVVPSQHWVTSWDGVSDIVQDGNIELGRSFFKVERKGRFDWVDEIYNGKKDLTTLDIPPVFKKRGWAYEREIRLVIKLESDIDSKNIAIEFDEPLEQLKESMKKVKAGEKDVMLGGRRTSNIKVWDLRFPLVQSSPWYKSCEGFDPIDEFKLDDAFKSEYKGQIKI